MRANMRHDSIFDVSRSPAATSASVPKRNFIAAKVRRHNDKTVAEGHSASLSICHMTFVKELQQNIEYINVRLLNFIKKYY